MQRALLAFRLCGLLGTCGAAAALASKPPSHLAKHPARGGTPVGPAINPDAVLLRYMYDGGQLSQGRLCELTPARPDAATGREVLAALVADGVDLGRFYPCVYETAASTGGWLPLLRHVRSLDGDADGGAAGGEDDEVVLPLAGCDAGDENSDGVVSRRIDVKLFARASPARDASEAEEAATPCGALPVSGYFGVGVVNTKNQANVGTLWRSAYQLGAQFVFTVGTRYRHAPTDTVRATQRLPLFEVREHSSLHPPVVHRCE